MFIDLQLRLAAQPADTTSSSHCINNSVVRCMEQQKKGDQNCVYMDIYERGEPEMQYLSARATRVKQAHTMVTPTEQQREPRLALLPSTATTPINAVVLDFTHMNEQGLHRVHAPAGRRRQFRRLVR